MTKRIIALLLALILTVGLLPTVALADGGTPAAGTSNDVKNGYYADTTWKEGTLNQDTLPTGVVSVSKTAKKVVGTENEYEVKLEVVLKKTESQENPGSAATVLVLDHSGSMNGCAYCKSTTDDRGNYYHTKGCQYDEPNQWVRVTSAQSRMTAATKAVKDFIKTYSGRFDKNGIETTTANLDLGRWVCLVWFNETGGVTGGSKWVDVSNADGYQSATNTSGWSAHDGTNLDCGLRLADHWLKQSPVASINKSLKNVIVLSDGEPTYYLTDNGRRYEEKDITIGNKDYYVRGEGSSCNEDTYNTTKSTAATLRNSASLYTVCFGASDNKIDDYDKDGDQKITVGNYLKQKIATQPKSGSNEQFAYDAADADALNTAFAAISKTIVSGLNTGTVKDTLPTGISSTVFGEGKTVMNWELNSDAFNKTKETKQLDDGTKETVYTYTKTYTVTIDPDNGNLVKTEDGYAPLNGETTLTVEVDGEKETIPFPIPAGKVTPTTFTVTWKSQDGEQTYETDNNVVRNSQPSYEGEVPTKDADWQFTYTFEGWAESPNQESGKQASELSPVTDNVTYYAAFSKQLKQYTVTGTIDNGTVNNKASTDTQTVNAGGSSAAMTFTPAAGYKIISVKEKVGEVETTITDFAETGYTYPVKNDIRANITVDVKTAKRSDLSYTVRYLEKGTTNVIKDPETVRDQEFGTEITAATIAKPEITGFTYDSCDPEKITIGTDSAQNVITLYYTRKSYTVTYTDGVNGTAFENQSTSDVAYGAPIPAFNGTPTREGYNFTGWTSSVTGVTTSSTMPDSNVTFTAGWTPKNKATINYEVVGPAGCGSVNPANEWKYVDDLTAAKGSTATANTGYRFVGWYDNEDCTDDALSTDLKYVPQTPTEKWANATYYAKFESLTYTITFTTEAGGTLTGKTEYTGLAYNADFPTEPGKVANTGYYFDGWYKDDTKVTLPGRVTENATYTAKWTQYAPLDLDLTGKFQKTLNSDVALTNETFTINLTLNGAEVPSATATATATATVSPALDNGSYTDTKPFVAASGDFKLTFTAPGTYIYSIVEEAPTRSGMTYDVNKPTDGHELTVNVTANDTHALSFESVTVDGTSIADVTVPTTWLTIANTYTEPKEPSVVSKTVVTTDMVDTLPHSVSSDIAVFKNINQVDILYPVVNGEASTLEVPYGTKSVTLLYKITVNAGTKTSMQFEDVGAECVSIVDDDDVDVSQVKDNFTVQFYRGVTTADIYVAKTYTNLVFDSNGECTVENAIGEIKATTTVTEKDPDKLYLDFSKYVQKELAATGSKTASDVSFRVIVNGMESPIMMYNAGEEEVSTYVEFDPRYSTVLDVNFASITGGSTETKDFTGSYVEIDQVGIYYFELNEEDGKRTGVTYDDSTYKVYVYVKREGDKLVVGSFDIYKDGLSVADETITFHNTIDTGKDDYYPIIIPTIINKDTGMLNKTDHFAYVIGYPDGTVHPNGQITRAEVATIFFRLLRDEVRDGAFTTSNSYSDVAYGKWYNNPISTMSALGIITGYPDGTFKPNKPITRAEFAAIAARFDETQSGKSATFSDVIGHWAAKEIGIAYYNDWIKGYPDGTFKPDQNITRAEAMTLINRVLERKPESPADLLTNMNKWTDNMDTSKWYYLDVQEATNSHGYTRKTFNYELWRQMLPDPDWSRYER